MCGRKLGCDVEHIRRNWEGTGEKWGEGDAYTERERGRERERDNDHRGERNVDMDSRIARYYR